MINRDQNYIHLFSNLHRAMEVAIVSGNKITAFRNPQTINTIARENVSMTHSELISHNGAIRIQMDIPQFSEITYKRKNFVSVPDMYKELEEKRNLYRNPDYVLEYDKLSTIQVLLKTAYERLDLSLYDLALISELARAIAILGDDKKIKIEHVAEAIQYRSIREELTPDGSISFYDCVPITW